MNPKVVTYEPLERHGRFGNQLWQVGATVGLARRVGARPLLPASWSYRPVLSCPDEWFTGDPAELAAGTPAPELARELHPWARTYLQHRPYLDAAEHEVRQAFRLAPDAAARLEEYRAGVLGARPLDVAIHVRRGDTTRNPPGTLNPLSAVWYVDALAALGAEGRLVVAVTDDPGWVQRQLGHVVAAVVSGPQRPAPYEGDYAGTAPDDWMDCYLMAEARALVISNSSYSWWAAWLGVIGNVAFPDPWFGPVLAPRHHGNRFVAPGWLAVPYEQDPDL